MFKIGELVVYPTHGLCQIDDITERDFRGEVRSYYVLHPKKDSSLTINVPVGSDKVLMLKTLTKVEALEILKLFNEPGMEWIPDVRQRQRKYSNMINSGDRRDICKIANTLLRKSNEAADNDKKLYEQDRKMLANIEEILFNELASALDTTMEDISKKINKMI